MDFHIISIKKKNIQHNNVKTIKHSKPHHSEPMLEINWNSCESRGPAICDVTIRLLPLLQSEYNNKI